MLSIALTAAHAQSTDLLDSVRAHQSDAVRIARQELEACKGGDACPSAPRLSLLIGYLLLSEGDAAGARQQLLSQRVEGPLEPFQTFYLAEAFAYTGDIARAQRGFARAAAGQVGPLTRRARAREAEMLSMRERWVETLLRLESLPDPLSPELLLLRAQSEAAVGRTEAMRSDLRTLLAKYPGHPAAEEARRLLEKELGTQVLWTFEERMARARRLLDGGLATLAWKELEETAAQKLGRGTTALAREALMRASVLIALGKETEGLKALEVALKGQPSVAAEALMLRARRAMRTPDLSEARRQMAEVEKRYPKEAPAAEAAFLTSWLDLQRNELAAAAKALAQYPDRYLHSQFRDDALWFAGLAFVRLQQTVPARAAFQRLQQQFPRSPLVPQAKYWAARALQLKGAPPADFRGELEETVRLFPGTLYALLAQQRLHDLGDPLTPIFPHPAGMKVEVPPELALATELSRAGLFRDAADELSLQVALVRGASDALAMGHVLQKLGEYGSAYTLAARALWGQGFGERKPEALALFFPQPYARNVQADATQNGISPFLVYAIMRRESGFQYDRISPANARGLMQVIPPTARAIAESRHQSAPLPDELYAPALNLDLGAWYLGRLNERFSHPALIAAAYNAGPAAVLRWTSAKGDEPLDMFIEDIPYKETRGYVKQVLADYFNYFDLYAAPAARPAWTWTLPKPAASGVSF